jgi:hypothetical protein
MFYIVCASTEKSSVRVACAGPVEAQAKVAELEQLNIGKVRVHDHAGKRMEIEDLAALAEAENPGPESHA